MEVPMRHWDEWLLGFIKGLPTRLSDRSRWIKILSLVGVAIGGTIVGDTFYDLLTGGFGDMSVGGRWLRGALVVIVVLLGAMGIEEILNIFRRRQPEVDPSRLLGLESTPALILIASASADPRKGPHWTALNYFADLPNSRLRWVYIVHSNHERSKRSANAIHEEVQRRSTLRKSAGFEPIDAFHGELEADFEDPENIFRTINVAIAMALMKVEEPDQVTLECTGGTAMASIGAALAKLRNPSVTLSYIPMTPDGLFGTIPKKVSLFEEASESTTRLFNGAISEDAEA